MPFGDMILLFYIYMHDMQLKYSCCFFFWPVPDRALLEDDFHIWINKI